MPANTPENPPQRLQSALNATKQLQGAREQAKAQRAAQRAAERSRRPVRKARQFNMELMPVDMAKIEEIRAWAGEEGQPIGRSQAVRLALRAIQLDETLLLPILKAMKAEDGRMKPLHPLQEP